jgi:hypothetical protein
LAQILAFPLKVRTALKYSLQSFEKLVTASGDRRYGSAQDRQIGQLD